jgi:predicted Rossmann-fold nucleotide-binding protein
MFTTSKRECSENLQQSRCCESIFFGRHEATDRMSGRRRPATSQKTCLRPLSRKGTDAACDRISDSEHRRASHPFITYRHSINEAEYHYSREVGHQLGLRELNICTGCGPGAMEGPMKGAAVGHANQRYQHRRYVGLTEPSIIAAEPPNPIVTELVILPDIEKRLEAFVRLGHGIIIFPGGVGTAEELLYILGILMNPANQHHPLPTYLLRPSAPRYNWSIAHHVIR